MSNSSEKLPFDDDDYETGSGISTTQLNYITSDDPFTMTTLLSNVRAFTGIVTTESSLHNLTSVKGADVQFKLYDIFIPTIGGIVLLMNLAVIISSGLILKGGAQPRTTYLFLGNVAMADLVTSVAILFGQLYPKDKRNEMLCILQIGMIVSSTLASVWSILLIGIDRFFYIVHALKYQQRLNPCRARSLIICTWILGLIIGFMPISGWKGPTNGGKYCWFIKLAPGELVLITTIIGCFPIIVITVLYSVILYHALKKLGQLQKADYEASVKQVQHDSEGNKLRMFRGGQSFKQDNPRTKKKKSPKKFRAVMVVGLTTGSFILTWVPYLIASVLYVVCRKTAKSEEDCKSLSLLIASPLAILGFANSLFNPLIYAWWHKGFRTFVCTKILRRKRLHYQSTTTSNKTTSSSRTRSSEHSSNNSRPTSRKISAALPEGPYIGETQDTRL